MQLYATFALNGPLKNCYLTIQTDSELTARKYLRFHFPYDWSGLYRETAFHHQPSRYNLTKIADVDLSSLNEGVTHEPHAMQREAE